MSLEQIPGINFKTAKEVSDGIPWETANERSVSDYIENGVSIVMHETRNLQKESIVELLRMADWAVLCIESWHEHCPTGVSGIDSYLPQLVQAISKLSNEVGEHPKWC